MIFFSLTGNGNQEDLEAEESEAVAELVDRNHANRVSQISSSGSSSNGSSTIIIHNNKDKWTTSVEIERNDSGLGSETGKSIKKSIKIRDKLSKGTHDLICEDCDQPIQLNDQASTPPSSGNKK